MTPAWLKEAWLNMVYRGVPFEAPAKLYVGLFSKAPGENGENEISGAGYARQLVGFAPPKALRVESAARVAFPEALDVWGAVTHFALFDAPTGGRLVDAVELDDHQWVGKHSVFEMPAGAVWARFPA
jgi:hypothetical protein